jgi:hypothetical protein
MKPMTQSSQPVVLSADEVEKLTVLVLRYLDGGCSAEEVEQLKGALAGAGPQRELFVQVCRLHGNLHENFAHKRAEMQQKATSAADLPPLSTSGDPGAETIISELTGDDTIHPEPKTPEQPSGGHAARNPASE